MRRLIPPPPRPLIGLIKLPIAIAADRYDHRQRGGDQPGAILPPQAGGALLAQLLVDLIENIRHATAPSRR